MGSINSIESFSTIDGPGIRSVVFFNQCLLRCKYCHNPEMWNRGNDNYTKEELVETLKKNKAYYGDTGGVTFSGGEPLLQSDFLIETCKLLKDENIHIALDTAGYGYGDYKRVLENIDLILFDIKDTREEVFLDLTGKKQAHVYEFLKTAKEMHKKFWIRQVIVPTLHDNKTYVDTIIPYLKKHFCLEDILTIEFIPYHKLGSEKYKAMHEPNPYEHLKECSKDTCTSLYQYFFEKWEDYGIIKTQ